MDINDIPFVKYIQRLNGKADATIQSNPADQSGQKTDPGAASEIPDNSMPSNSQNAAEEDLQEELILFETDPFDE